VKVMGIIIIIFMTISLLAISVWHLVNGVMHKDISQEFLAFILLILNIFIIIFEIFFIMSI
jgi:hypothetical protein